jgi:hypothetical protein
MSVSLDSLPEGAWRKKLVGIHAAAEYVDTSIYEIRRLVKLGLFPQPCKPNGRQWRWQLGALADWSDEKARETPAPRTTAQQEIIIRRTAKAREARAASAA